MSPAGIEVNTTVILASSVTEPVKTGLSAFVSISDVLSPLSVAAVIPVKRNSGCAVSKLKDPNFGTELFPATS